MSRRSRETDFFWDLAAALQAADNVSEGSLMGFPCLRAGGAFFATCDHRSGDLIVKLPAARVRELIAEDSGAPFAPAGRVFKEWVSVSERDAATWTTLLAEAKAFAVGIATRSEGIRRPPGSTR